MLVNLFYIWMGINCGVALLYLSKCWANHMPEYDNGEYDRRTKRAMRLLRSWLTPEQNRDLTTKEAFYVTSQSGRTYRIAKGTVSNVELLGADGCTTARFCVQPAGAAAFPGDVMLAQKLWLETDELDFLVRANRFVPPSCEDDLYDALVAITRRAFAERLYPSLDLPPPVV